MSRNPILVESISFERLVSHLKVLKLNGVKLHAIPEPIYQLNLLQQLELEGNQLTVLNGSLLITSFPKLEELDVSNNSISKLPVELAKLQLRFIGWQGNPLVFPNRSVATRGTSAILQWLSTHVDGK